MPTSAEFVSANGAMAIAAAPSGAASPDWIQAQAPGSPAPLMEGKMVYDAAIGLDVMFGGRFADDSYSDQTWTWNGATWTQLHPLVSPSARRNSQMAYDSKRRVIVLFSGSSVDSPNWVPNDTWLFDGANWVKQAPATSPPGAEGGVMAYDAAADVTVLFTGGRYDPATNTYYSYESHTWVWNGSTWTQRDGSVAPSGRRASGMIYDPNSQRVILFGGLTTTADFNRPYVSTNDTWVFHGGTWAQLAPSTAPPVRLAHYMAYDDDLQKIVVFGGQHYINDTGTWYKTFLNDTWLYDGSNWAEAKGIAAPSSRQWGSAAYSPITNQVTIWGGSSDDTYPRPELAETWTYNTAIATITKVLTSSVATYSRGMPLAYSLTVGNPGRHAMPKVSIKDVPRNISLAGSTLSVDSGTPTSCTVKAVQVAEPTSVNCYTVGDSLFATNLAVNAGQSVRLDVLGVVLGAERGCTTGGNSAQAFTFGHTTDPAPYGASPTSTPADVLICDNGLGLEKWWTYNTRGLGQAASNVNMANGNLVVQQLDSTPVQGHGHLGLALRRTYNSEDTTLLSYPGKNQFGTGWVSNVDAVGDLAGDGVGATGLYVPSMESVSNALGVTLIDGDGTRHVFRPHGLAASIDVLSLSGGAVVPDVSGSMASLVPRVLTLDPIRFTDFDHVCVDQTFSSPPGVHLSLWRYLALKSSSSSAPCSPAGGTTPLVLGFAAERPDRLRYEFFVGGQMTDVADGSGNELKYEYGSSALVAGASLSPLTRVYEPTSGRAMTFTYPSSTETDVVDAASRTTKYVLDGNVATPHLLRVVNPDSTAVSYSYGGCAGSTSNQMCSETDPRGNVTSFSYTTTSSDGAPSTFLGPPRLLSISDRRGNAAATKRFSYFVSPDYVTVDQSGQRRRYQAIDSRGRVGEVDEGDTGDVYLHQTISTWDGTGAAACRQPDAVLDNNLCRQVRKSLTTATADQDTSYVYNSEGATLVEHRVAAPVNLDTTNGYHAQYLEASGASVPFDDTVTGSGAVASGGPTTGRADAGTLFAISDRTQSLSPRGNAAGGGYGAYLTRYKVDDLGGTSPNARATSTVCSDPAAPSSNSGSLCETDRPGSDGGPALVTRYTYDTYGQRATMASPKSLAEGSGQVTTYTYFADADRDLSGTVSAGGWMKAVTDPTGHFAAFAYDAAGDPVRTWDRNATQGRAIGDFPGSVNSPASPAFAETLYGTPGAAYASPWRFPLSQRDQLGDLTTFAVDANGNQLSIRPPRGNAASSASFDTTKTYDQDDNLTSTLAPVEAAQGKASTLAYDAFDNRTSLTDPNGNSTTTQYDSVSRPTTTRWSRGPWPSDTTTVPAACRQSTTTDSPIPAARILCSSAVSYDGVDNKLSTQDGNGQTTTFKYDGGRREILRQVPRNDGTLSNVTTGTAYDPDGHVTDHCPPRQYSEGAFTVGSACQQPAIYSEHMVYDPAGRLTAKSTYRSVNGTTQTNTTTASWDADGNQTQAGDANGHLTAMVYDLLDRKTSMSVPRDASHTNVTRWSYDPSGNLTAVLRPGDLQYGSGQDGVLVVDGSQHPQGNPQTLPSGGNFTNVTLQNGGWLVAASGGSLKILATGTITICATCGISLTGTGPGGGAGGTDLIHPGNPGGGPGGGRGGGPAALNGGGGGGAGHAGPGQSGRSDAVGNGSAGTGGNANGGGDLSDESQGSGGGGGGRGGLGNGSPGGAGGGFVHITASTIDDFGTIAADGLPGGSAPNGVYGGGGGGGSGGSVWLTAGSINLASGQAVSVAGGSGGSGNKGNSGGAASNGLVRLDADVVTGAGASGNGSWSSAYHKYVGRITAYSYDAANRLADTIEGASDITASAAGATDAAGGTNIRRRRLYDPDGHVVARLDPRAFSAGAGAPDPLFMLRTDFDADGRPTNQFVPRYDNVDDGQRYSDLALSNIQGQQCPPTQSAPTKPQAISGIPAYPGNVGLCVTGAQYDAVGNRTRVLLPTAPGEPCSPSNRYVALSYTDDNLLASVDAPRAPSASSACTRVPQQVSYLYDGDRMKVKSTDVLGIQQTTSYFSDELVKQVTNQPGASATHVFTYGYDANGNRTTVTDPAQNVSRNTFYSDNRVNYSEDGAGDRTTYSLDAVGNVTQVVSPAGYSRDASNTAAAPTVNGYTFDNLLATATIPVASDGTRNRRTDYGYDRGGRKTAQHVYLVDGAGAPVGMDGGTQSFSYFDDDRQATQTGRDGSTITSSYDPAGNRLSVRDSTSGASTITSNYYLDGLPRVVDDGQTQTQLTYDGAGQRSARQDQVDGTSTKYRTTYTYGDSGAPASMTSDAVQSGSTSWAYDAGGRPLSESAPNGTALNWTFSADNTLQAQSLTKGGSTLASWGYCYDNDYRVTDQSFSASSALNGCQPAGAAGSFHFGYDAASRLATFTNGGAPAQGLTWDHSGNRLTYGSGQQSYNADNSIRNVNGGSTFSYQPFGGVASDGCTNYSYDGFDRMSQANQVAGASCPVPATQPAKYAYDGLDRQRSHDEGTGATSLHYDGLTPTVSMETAPTTGVKTAYELDPQGKRKGLTQFTPLTPTTQYVADDGHGNISTTTSTTGGVACAARLDPFGTPLNPQSGSNPCSSGSTPSSYFFRSARRDTTTGNYQFGSRTYDPAKATFLAPDSYRADESAKDLSIGTDPLTQNRYSYVNGDPVNLVDPTGHTPCEEGSTCETDRGAPIQVQDSVLGARYRRAPAPPKVKLQYVKGMNEWALCDDRGNCHLSTTKDPISQSETKCYLDAKCRQTFSDVSSNAALAFFCDCIPGGIEGAPAAVAEEDAAISAEDYALGFDPARGKFIPGEAETAKRIQSETGVKLTRRAKGQKGDWIGDDGKVYDAIGNFAADHFDSQWDNVQRQISSHLTKADYVPVDVSQFSPDQVSKVIDYISQFEGRVFVVGQR